MKVKITKTQLKQLIKEEATRYKKVLELQDRKAEIERQINEIYESDIDMEEGWLGDKMSDLGHKIGKGAANLIQGSDEEWKEKVKNHFDKMQRLAYSRGVQFEMPVDENDWNEAFRVAKLLGTADIVKRDGKWVSRMRFTPNYQSS